MSKVVFILGAGASAHCGTPLMANFLDVARDLWLNKQVPEAEEHFKSVFEAIGKLQGIHSKAKLDTYNIETVYAAFEMGELLGRLPDITSDGDIQRLTTSVRKVIGYTLERTTKLPHAGTGEVLPPSGYSDFARLVQRLSQVGMQCSVLSFNYDLGFEYALHSLKITPDYGLEPAPQDVTKITYLKLHGSINWAKCGRTDCPYKITPVWGRTETRSGQNFSTLPVLSVIKSTQCKCGEHCEEDPFIVPPTWSKAQYQELVRPVWRKAAHVLSDAEHVFVTGYSLPPTDQFFNYLFALGVDRTTWLRGFYVYDYSDSVETRFRELLGSGVQQRYYFKKDKFESAFTGSNPIIDQIIRSAQ